MIKDSPGMWRPPDLLPSPRTVHDELRNKSVLILLRGQAFRSGQGDHGHDVPCNITSFEAQREATESIVTMVVLPLLKAGVHGVDIALTMPRCADGGLLAAIVGWLSLPAKRFRASAQVVAVRVIDSASECDGWRESWRLQHDYRRATDSSKHYDFLFLARHDVAVDVPLTSAPLTGWARGYSTGEHSIARSSLSFDRMLFVQEGRMCRLRKSGSSCNSGRHPAWDYMHSGSGNPVQYEREYERWLQWVGGPTKLAETYKWPLECQECARDHMLWMPLRHVMLLDPLVLGTQEKVPSMGPGRQLGQFNGVCGGHGMLREVRQSQLVPDHEIGFMWPTPCPSKHNPQLLYAAQNAAGGEPPRTPQKGGADDSRLASWMMCDEKRLYRPVDLNQHRG